MTDMGEITVEADINDGIKNETIVEVQSVPCDTSGVLSVDWVSSLSNQSSSNKQNRSDSIAQAMGQYLLKGYKMLATTCPQCDCILMEDRNRQTLCIGCDMDNTSSIKCK